MVVKEIIVKESLVVDKDTLEQAGLAGPLKLIIQKGEIRILPQTTIEPEILLETLAGCLGEEAAEDYDFKLDIGGYYETR